MCRNDVNVQEKDESRKWGFENDILGTVYYTVVYVDTLIISTVDEIISNGSICDGLVEDLQIFSFRVLLEQQDIILNWEGQLLNSNDYNHIIDKFRDFYYYYSGKHWVEPLDFECGRTRIVKLSPYLKRENTYTMINF